MPKSDDDEQLEGATPCLLQVYLGDRGWRWRLSVKGNSKIVGGSTEAYRKLAMCMHNFYFVTGHHLPVLKAKKGQSAFRISLVLER